MAGCNDGDNKGQGQKRRRPEGFRVQAGLALLLLRRRLAGVCSLVAPGQTGLATKAASFRIFRQALGQPRLGCLPQLRGLPCSNQGFRQNFRNMPGANPGQMLNLVPTACTGEDHGGSVGLLLDLLDQGFGNFQG